jgi:hypothetical protein
LAAWFDTFLTYQEGSHQVGLLQEYGVDAEESAGAEKEKVRLFEIAGLLILVVPRDGMESGHYATSNILIILKDTHEINLLTHESGVPAVY